MEGEEDGAACNDVIDVDDEDVSDDMLFGSGEEGDDCEALLEEEVGTKEFEEELEIEEAKLEDAAALAVDPVPLGTT